MPSEYYQTSKNQPPCVYTMTIKQKKLKTEKMQFQLKQFYLSSAEPLVVELAE